MLEKNKKKKKTAEDILNTFLMSQKIGFDILCKLSQNNHQFVIRWICPESGKDYM